VFSELIESLRCVRPHEPTGLVAVAFKTVDRDIVSGSLGCPACKASYPVEGSIADFRLGSEGPAAPPAKTRPAEELAVRAGALLGLTEPGGLVVLAGTWSACAPEIAALAEPVKVLALDPAAGIASGAGVSLALTAGEVPLKAGSARGIALDAAHATDGYLAAAAGALAPRGRLVAPAEAAVPAGFTELARDARDWVAEKIDAPAIVPIARAKRQSPPPGAS
jgi:uncharacterized protein YbaR (Trm112 family)